MGKFFQVESCSKGCFSMSCCLSSEEKSNSICESSSERALEALLIFLSLIFKSVFLEENDALKDACKADASKLFGNEVAFFLNCEILFLVTIALAASLGKQRILSNLIAVGDWL
eukprot:snap_masked-scaffold_67-processed-gene-0.61-mRNA-1 protein AED:1.00 eAED:1.00 QI:0/0/0/0/1/1/2/0/113